MNDSRVALGCHTLQCQKRTKVRTKDLRNMPWRTLHGVWVKFHILVCGYQATTNSLVGMLLSVKYTTQFSTSDLIGRRFCGTHNLSSNVSPVNQSSSSVPDIYPWTPSTSYNPPPLSHLYHLGQTVCDPQVVAALCNVC